jgi:hypothetical protein
MAITIVRRTAVPANAKGKINGLNILGNLSFAIGSPMIATFDVALVTSS